MNNPNPAITSFRFWAFAQIAACLLIFSLPASQLAGQAGDAVLRGQVSNQATGDNLGGATVRVEVAGVTRTVYTERDGTFVVRNLPAGAASVRVVFPGLDAQTATVNLTSGVTARQNFGLTADIYVLPEFAVAGTREGNALAIARQEQSTLVVNAVSADAFGSIAKNNIGNVLARLPGVVGTMDGAMNTDQVSVRGMAEEHTTVNIDGTAGAGADTDTGGRGSLPLGSVPAAFIESVEVIKTPTADMDADSLGGVINLRTKSAFDRTGRTLDLMVGSNYNTTYGKKIDTTGRGQYLFPIAQLNYADVYSVFGGDNNLGMIFTGSHTESGEVTSTSRLDFEDDWDFEGPIFARRQNFLSGHKFDHVVTTSGTLKFDYRLDEGSSLTFSSTFTRYGRAQDDLRPRMDNNVIVNTDESTDFVHVFDRARYEIQRDTRISMPMKTWRWNLQGEHDLNNYKVTWDTTYSTSRKSDLRWEMRTITGDDIAYIWDRTNPMKPRFIQTGGRPLSENNLDNVTRQRVQGRTDFTAHDVVGARFDIERVFDAGRIPFTLKTGARWREDFRSENRNRMDNGEAFAFFGPDMSQYVDPNFTYDWPGGFPHAPAIDTVRFMQDAGWRYVPEGNPDIEGLNFVWNPDFFTINANNSIRNSNRNDWDTRDSVTAAFFQGQFELTEQLRMTAGVRFEMTDVSVSVPVERPDAPSVFERWSQQRTMNSDYKHWFPNLQFRYEPWERVIFRAAYSTTIGRPKIGDIAGRWVENSISEVIVFGNAGLKPQTSDNFDVSVEYYFEPVGVFSVGVFRKQIKNFITPVNFTITGNEYGLDLSEFIGWEGRTNDNIGKAEVDGIEFNYSQQFTFLPGIFGGLGTYFNYTALSSSGDFGNLNPPEHLAGTIKNVLPRFRPESFNGGISWGYGRWDIRFQWSQQAAFLHSPDFSDPSDSTYLTKRDQIDVFAKFRLTPRFELFADVINLGTKNRGRALGVVRPERIADVDWYSTVVSAGVRASF